MVISSRCLGENEGLIPLYPRVLLRLDSCLLKLRIVNRVSLPLTTTFCVIGG